MAETYGRRPRADERERRCDRTGPSARRLRDKADGNTDPCPARAWPSIWPRDYVRRRRNRQRDDHRGAMTGPLGGVRIIQVGGIGPGPFACTMLADHGAEVIRVERPGWGGEFESARKDVLLRSRRIIAVNLKAPEGAELVRDLTTSADAVVEGFRPGVTEKLGLGPKHLLAVQPRLIYGRMTGWGQHGPLSGAAGHDINYIAVA